MQLQTRDFLFTYPSVLVHCERLFIHLRSFVSSAKSGTEYVSEKHRIPIEVVGMELSHQVRILALGTNLGNVGACYGAFWALVSLSAKWG